MTRINLIEPSELSSKHLIAEYRELPRIFSLVKAAIARGEQPNDIRNPTDYVLGTGHCRFFYNKLSWLRKRFLALVTEMQCRGYHTIYTDYDINSFPANWRNDYVPTNKDLELNRQRIRERLGA